MKIYAISQKIGFAFLILSIVISSCTPSREKAQKKIAELENILRQDTVGNNSTAISNTLNEYKKYAKSFPKDTLSAEFLFKAAMLCMNTSKSKEAIELIDQLIKDYPNYKKVSDCLFIKGFIYENNLKDYVNAKKSYEEFLKKYPNHVFASSAQSSLKYLGKSPEEILKELDKNKNSAVTKK